MSLLDTLRSAGAQALDLVLDTAPEGVPMAAAVVIWHPGVQGDDAIVISTHETPELLAVVAHVDRARCETGIVTQNSYAPGPIRGERSVQ